MERKHDQVKMYGAFTLTMKGYFSFLFYMFYVQIFTSVLQPRQMPLSIPCCVVSPHLHYLTLWEHHNFEVLDSTLTNLMLVYIISNNFSCMYVIENINKF